VKWTHHFLTSDDLTFINNLQNKLKTVNHYTESKPGIVTGANKYFIIDKETENKYNLSKYTKPIIQKGLFVNGSVVFKNKDLKKLEKNNRPTKLLQLNDTDKISKQLREYLEIGELEDLPERHKCGIRKNWYVIPNISKKPDAFFFKRSHLYPKLLKNSSSAFVTDSAYKVKMRNDYDLNSFIYSFYNTLTLILSELDGRYYGGGVLELIPSEFKKLPVPYKVINNIKFDNFTANFENKSNIESILIQNDLDILNPSLGINNEDLLKLTEIRNKLKRKRLRN
jgi:adenine-specific DNA-methyltransferase